MDIEKLFDEFDAGRRERAVFMTQVLAIEIAERQAAALERIAASLENNMGDMEAHIHLLTLAIEKIAGSKGIIGTRNADAV